jgi:hypothetical protein
MLPYIDDFARSLLADNRLTVMSLEAGEVVGLEEVVHLGAEALHMLLTLHCRSLDRVEQCTLPLASPCGASRPVRDECPARPKLPCAK